MTKEAWLDKFRRQVTQHLAETKASRYGQHRKRLRLANRTPRKQSPRMGD